MNVSWRLRPFFFFDNKGMEKELLEEIKSGKDEAFKEFIELYRPMILSIIKRIAQFYGSDFKIDHSDLLQEGLIALYDAAMSYRDDGKAKFSTYAYTIIYRRLSKYYHSQIAIYTHEGHSLDHERYENKEIMPSERYYDNPAQMFLLKQTLDFASNFYKGLSPLEKKILELHDQKYSYKRIAELLGIKEKRVDYLLSKIKTRYKSLR